MWDFKSTKNKSILILSYSQTEDIFIHIIYVDMMKLFAVAFYALFLIVLWRQHLLFFEFWNRKLTHLLIFLFFSEISVITRALLGWIAFQILY